MLLCWICEDGNCTCHATMRLLLSSTCGRKIAWKLVFSWQGPWSALIGPTNEVLVSRRPVFDAAASKKGRKLQMRVIKGYLTRNWQQKEFSVKQESFKRRVWLTPMILINITRPVQYYFIHLGLLGRKLCGNRGTAGHGIRNHSAGLEWLCRPPKVYIFLVCVKWRANWN